MLFVGALYQAQEHYDRAKELLTSLFGDALLETPELAWDYTSHYSEELGDSIKRRFLFFDSLISQEELPEIKIKTMEIETALSGGGKRRVNLDPGYVTEAKVVLATKKDYSHRLAIGRGVFAEVTLTYSVNRFVPHPYTYKDYSDEYIALFDSARKFLRKKLCRVTRPRRRKKASTGKSPQTP